MIRLLPTLLVTVILTGSSLVSTSANTTAPDDPATTFWRNWTTISNIYHFRFEIFDSRLEIAKKYNFPKDAIRELAAISKQCRERVAPFEEAAIAKLRTQFTGDQLRELNELIQTDIGKYFLIEGNFLFTLSFVEANYDAADVKRLKNAMRNGLLKAFDEKTDELLNQLRSRGQPILDAHNAQKDQFIAIYKRNDPRNVLAEPIDTKAAPTTLNILTPPSPAVAAYLETNGLATNSYDLDFNDSNRRIGDKLTTLVSYGDGKLEQQWIMTFEVVEKDEAEAARSRDDVSEIRYTNLGNTFTFTSEIGAIKIATIGPFETNSPKDQSNVPIRTTRKLLKSDFLTIGLYNMAAFFCRYNEMKANNTYSGYFDLLDSNKPFDDETIKKTRKSVQQLNITEAEERSYAGYIKALWQFFQVAYHTDELHSIMVKVMRLPSIFTLATKPTKPKFSLQIKYFKPVPKLDLAPSAPIISTPYVMSLNGKPSLFLRLFVAPSIPPLQTSAGIYGLVASDPENANKRLVVRVLSGRRGPKDKDTVPTQ